MKHAHSGFITLIAVIILTVVSVAIVISILTTGISSGKISQGNERDLAAKSFANNCAEYALVTIRDLGVGTDEDNDGFSKTLDVPDNEPEMGINSMSCSVDVIDNGGESRTIQSTGMVSGGETVSRILVEVSTISPRIVVTSWEEVDSF